MRRYKVLLKMGDKTSVRHSCTETPTPYENNSISYQQSSLTLE